MDFEKFGKSYWHKNPRNIYIPHSVQYKYAEQPKECTGSYEYVSKKPRRVNRKWEEITAAFGILSDTTDSSLLEMGIPDKI
jgi:hypothetical protein